MRILLNNITYSYEIIGSGPKLLFLHGFTGSKQNWKGIASNLSEHFTVITIDLIGHGETDSPLDSARYEMNAACLDLNLFLEKLDINTVQLVGYSMGGRLAIAFALSYPNRVSSLILESSSPGIERIEERNLRILSDEQLAEEIVEKGITEFVNKWENIPLFESQKLLPESIQAAIRAERLTNNPIGLAGSLKGMGTGKQPSYWDQLQEIKIPSLFICGEWDEKFCTIAEEMSVRVPNSTIQKVFNAGHAIHVEQPEFFGKIVVEFLHSLTNKEE
ncbi:2-succinyl-6-hydroxy-2,4-cyclohexadiene-1-carboxylate synthase [Bacillus salitolerans]|uniref:Putative 2-succinyl-6-hydroxy-2,4-cyclohexadiene-1-carboxylate synthase n=1 Tax=Bacillus salitolerans TaxID=1437434 RepID=A0ABW4LVT9_9BACI